MKSKKGTLKSMKRRCYNLWKKMMGIYLQYSESLTFKAIIKILLLVIRIIIIKLFSCK